MINNIKHKTDQHVLFLVIIDDLLQRGMRYLLAAEKRIFVVECVDEVVLATVFLFYCLFFNHSNI